MIQRSDDSVIPSSSDSANFRENADAIDQLVKTDKYRFIVAWGKWLGFTPKTVERYLQEAEAEGAPENVVQKIDGKWIGLDDIENEANRRRVEEIARLGL